MIVKGIIFDINGTLSDIHTDEWHEDVYRVISNLLSYQGISLDPQVVKDLYFQIMKEQRTACGERHPEFDAVGIFRDKVESMKQSLTPDSSALVVVLDDRRVRNVERDHNQAHAGAVIANQIASNVRTRTAAPGCPVRRRVGR